MFVLEILLEKRFFYFFFLGMIKKKLSVSGSCVLERRFFYLIIRLFGGWRFTLFREEFNFLKINNI